MNKKVNAKKNVPDKSSVYKKKIKVLEESAKELKASEKRQALAAQILCILNDAHDITDTIKRILNVIKQETGFDAVGIRLRNGKDFPYFVQNGFSHDFLLKENSILGKDAKGGICRDPNGNISLECTCGLVIMGKTDPSNSLFTEAGSAWTNKSLTLLALTAEQDPRLHPRNTCVHSGYLSVALIPIRKHGEIVGLLQLNDRKAGRFTLDIVRFFEGMAASIGLALMRKQEEEEKEKLISDLKKVISEVKTLSGMLPICASCKKIRDDKGYWSQIETYIKEHSDAEFTHGVCPECAIKLYPAFKLY
jgi:transcriptional regulator with GAF, ATPase, and Fis domain